MIVVDTNVIAYLFIKGNYTPNAKRLLHNDSTWTAPLLWRSEFRNVLALYMRQGFLSVENAYLLMNEAEDFMQQNEYEMNSLRILEIASSSGCSAYDCEFIALAEFLNVKLYTTDKKILNTFPDISVSLKDI
ncbi:MAG: VapC toxin family PIN domain ribonuclease [Candidatus Brocadia sp. WS118]|nr:MAG: VapC toxin family PIN domain ribonuclease [Candidatus Brocadia sp. WS118]